MSRSVVNGAEVTVAMLVQAVPSNGLRSKTTRVALALVLALSVIVPRAGELGFASVTVGAVLSIVTFRAADVAVLPAPSVTTICSCVDPSCQPTELRTVE